MFPKFAAHVDRMPDLFAKLDNVPLCAFSAIGLPAKPAVYAFIENQKGIRIGRTGNLKRRIQSHAKLDHRSAAFAFKLARNELGYLPTYQTEGSRKSLQQDEGFMKCFKKQVDRLKLIHLRYISLDDQIDQYLLELYASMVYGLSLDEFDNH